MANQPPDSNNNRKTPPAVQTALEALKLLADEDAAAAEAIKKLLPAFAMKLSKAGEDVTVDLLLGHARQGVGHLTAARTDLTGQKTLTYAEVVARFKNPEEKRTKNLDDLALAAAGPDAEQKLKDLIANLTKKQREFSLLRAAEAGCIETIRELLDLGTISADGDKFPGAYALRKAAQSGHIEIIRLLLDHGVNIHDDDDRALDEAACGGHTETVRLLLDRGADIHAGNDMALFHAAQQQRPETMHLLIERGAGLTKLKPEQFKFYHDFCTAKDYWGKVAHCEPPKWLWQENPALFRPQAFDAVNAMIATEGECTNQSAFNAVALFQTKQRVLQYLEKWGEPGKQPLHDITYFIKAPKETGADLKAWGDAALKLGPGMAKLFAFADRLPAPEKSADGKTWSLKNTREKAAQFNYARGAEHAELANLCFENTLPEEDFNTALKLVKTQKKDLIKNLPAITIDGSHFDMDGAVFRPLPANDVRGLFLGELTDCCQSIGGAGAKCAEHGFMSRNSGFYVVEAADHEIIGQTWAWRGRKGELVFDSLETLGKRVTDKQWEKLTTEFAKALAEKPGNVTALHIGTGGATPKSLAGAFNAIAAAQPVDYNGYRDSTNQMQVWKRKSWKL